MYINNNDYKNINKNINITYIVLIASVVIFGGYLIQLIQLIQLGNESNIDTMKFIKFFNIVMAIVGSLSTILSYKSNKKQEMFFISIMFCIFAIDIAMANTYQYMEILNANLKSSSDIYMSIGGSMIRMMLVILSIMNSSKLKDIILKNKLKSIILILIITLIFMSLEYTQPQIYGKNVEVKFILLHITIFLVCMYTGILYLIKAIKEKESIYSIIGSSLFMFSIKSIYSIAGKIYTNPTIELTSVSITYLGFITIILGLFVEIIQSKKRNEYLKEELELFYKIIDESGHSAKIICDEKGEFIYANKSALKYYLDKYGVNLNDVINKKIDKKSIIHNEKEYYEKEYVIEKELEKNNKYSFEMKIDDRYIECFIQRIKKKGKNYKIVSFRDITDRHEMEKTILEYEKVKQQELVRNEFFANISHELKTPINILYSTIQLLTYKSSEANFKEIYLKHMKSLRMNCQRMLRLIDNIVDITKFETGYKMPEFKNYDIIRLVEEISLSVINYAKRKNIDLIFDTEIEELKIKCDQDMIERVMLNLLSNAIKFTEIGGNIKVYMKADKDWVHISVIDDGVGIPLESQPYVFERFVQVDKSIRRKNEGSGIGLSIVKSIIDLNDGHICLKSDGKNGCEFKVLLPNKVINDNEIKENTNKNLDIQKIQLELSDIYEVYEK